MIPKDEYAWATKALTALSVAFIFVYIVFWAVRGEALMTVGSTSMEDLLAQNDTDILPNELLDVGDVSEAELAALTDRPQNAVGRTFYSVQDLFGGGAYSESNDLVLPGTHAVENTIASLELLGFTSPSPVLADERGILYTFLWKAPEGLESSVLRLWWNIVEIADKKDIQYHRLLGEKVTFVNLPMYTQKQVVLLITFEKEHTWFVQIPYGVYYTAKSLLPQRFGMLYDL
jgi:hypothetical protein